MALFELPDGTAHFIGDNARAAIGRESCFYYAIFAFYSEILKFSNTSARSKTSDLR